MILCPIDFSAPTEALVRAAAALAHAEPHTALTLLHVSPTILPISADAIAFEALRRLPNLAGLVVRTLNVVGCPARAIVEQAADLGASLIVLGAHGAGGLSRFLMGSTAEAVLRTAPCPTLLLTLPAEPIGKNA